MPARECKARVFAMLKRVGLSHRRSHHPLALSGGEQQRLALARALVTKPRLILADEPTGALDSETSRQIMDLFDAVNAEGMTVLTVTHDAEVAARSSRIIRLKDGRIESRAA